MELIVSIAILSILAAFAAPAMREFSIRANVNSTTNDIVVALNLARAEAVKRGANVSVVATGGDWNDGWSVQDAGGVELIAHGAVATDYTVLGAATGAGAPADRVVFNRVGALDVATGYDFSICRPSSDADATQSRRIIVSGTGVVRSRRDTTGAPAGACS
ncbi:MAG: hypothetical protein AMXMBFR25_06560 [Lysobacterales bacterium]